jgi:hypothetical protein
LIRGERLIGAGADPGIRSLALAVALEALDQLANSAAQHGSRAQAAEEAAKATGRALLGRLGIEAGSTARSLPTSEKLLNLVAVLITGYSEKSQ